MTRSKGPGQPELGRPGASDVRSGPGEARTILLLHICFCKNKDSTLISWFLKLNPPGDPDALDARAGANAG